MKYLYDVMAVLGTALVGVGVWQQFGWPISLIIVGSLILTAAIKGAMNVTREDSQSTHAP